MLIPRDSHRASTLNNIIYVVGGRNRNGPLRRVDAYDFVANTWSIRQSLPKARFDLNGVSVIGGRLYVTGGFDNAGILTKTLYVYNPRTNLWVQRADMPQAGGCGIQGVIAGLLYVYAGCTATGQGRMFRYSSATNTWITLATPPSEHFYGGGGVIGGKFYLAGGGFDRDKLDVYNPATNTWTTRAPMAAPAGDVASTVLNGKLYVAGGRGLGDGGVLATLRVYSPGTNRWTIRTPMPTRRHVMAGAAAGGLFFVLGGIENSVATRTVVAYTP
jgi:N-acetylneuraminic acid mutarotase